MSEHITDFKRENYTIEIGETVYNFKNIEVSPFGEVVFIPPTPDWDKWEVDEVFLKGVEIHWLDSVDILNENGSTTYTMNPDFSNYNELYDFINTKEIHDYIIKEEYNELEEIIINKEI